MTHRIPVLSDQTLTARAVETLKAYKQTRWPGNDIEFAEATADDKRVLVFGKVPEGIEWPNTEFIYTYSIAQVLTKSNAVTVLDSAIEMVVNGKRRPNIVRADWSTPASIGRVLEGQFRYNEPIAIDIETNGILGVTHTPDEVMPFSVALYQDHWDRPITLVSGQSKFEGPCTAFTVDELRTLAHYLLRFTKPVYHNGKFDTRVLNRVLSHATGSPVRLAVWFDTMLAHHVLNHSAGEHGLKILAQRYFGAEDWESDMKHALGGSKDYSAMSVRAVAKYNGWDVVWTMELFKFLKPQIDADSNAELNLFFEQQVADMLLDVERNGIPVDENYIAKYGGQLEGDMLDYREMLIDETGVENFNPNSPKQIKDWYLSKGLELAKTDEQTLQTVLDNYDDTDKVYVVADLILKYREASKRKGTYAEGWSKRSRDGRVHPTFLVHGTRTGRLSSTGPNAQNMPRDKDVRKIVG